MPSSVVGGGAALDAVAGTTVKAGDLQNRPACIGLHRLLRTESWQERHGSRLRCGRGRVRLVWERLGEYPSWWAVVWSIAAKSRGGLAADAAQVDPVGRSRLLVSPVPELIAHPSHSGAGDLDRLCICEGGHGFALTVCSRVCSQRWWRAASMVSIIGWVTWEWTPMTPLPGHHPHCRYGTSETRPRPSRGGLGLGVLGVPPPDPSGSSGAHP